MTTVRCALYCCRLRWQSRLSVSRQAVHRRPAKSSFDQATIPLRCSGRRHVIDTKHTLDLTTGRLANCAWKAWPLERELLVSAVVGYAAMVATFVAASTSCRGTSTTVWLLGITSLAATARVSLFFVCCVDQLDLLWNLHSSFHFLFVFVQLVLAHLCVGAMSHWDGRALASAASLLWVHWALTVDAVPPHRRKLLTAKARWLAAAVEAAFLVGLVLLAYDLLGPRSQGFTDNGMADWSVESFFLNRFATLFAWLGRSLWRATYDADEFFVLHGAFEYDDYEMTKRQTKSTLSKARILQITSALSEQSKKDSQSNGN